MRNKCEPCDAQLSDHDIDHSLYKLLRMPSDRLEDLLERLAQSGARALPLSGALGL